MARQMNLSLVIGADARGVAPATAEVRREVESVGAAGRQAAQNLEMLAAANDEAAAAARRATEAMRGQSAVERDLRAAVNDFAGIRPALNDNGYRQRQADIAAYGAELDRLRARFVPAAAAEQSLLAVQRDINDAFRVGAISAEEQAAALERNRLAHDRAAAAAAAQAEEYRRLAAAGREAWAADQAQNDYNRLLGVGAMPGRSAAASADMFAEAGMFDRVQSGAEGTARAIGLATHEMTNLTYQTNDMVMMLMMGQEPLMTFLQQGPQVAQIMGQRGLGEILPALGQSIRALITPTTLFLGGLVAAGYAGYAAFRMIQPEVLDADAAMERHAETVEELARGYGLVAEKIKGVSLETSNLIGFRAARSEAEMRILATRESDRLLRPDSWLGMNPLGAYEDFVQRGVEDSLSALQSVFSVDPKFRQFEQPILRFIAAIREDGGLDAVRNFRREIAERWAMEPNNKELRDLAATLLDATDAMLKHADATEQARRASQALGRNVDAAGRVRAADWMRDDMDELRLFRSQEALGIRRDEQAFEADILGLRARSPGEQAAAARARETARYDDNESALQRRHRIDLAGRQALAEAEHQLAEAARERARSYLEAVAAARLDLDLVGKSAAEVDRLRMEHQMLSELRREAAANGVAASRQEIDAIRAVAAETASLRAIAGAREFIRSRDEELMMMRAQIALTGASEPMRARVIAQMETEREIRSMGIDAMGREAEQMRAGALRLAETSLELDRMTDAWGAVQSAGESAIDNVFGRLMDGDWEGALRSFGDEMLNLSMQLAVTNPLKNAMFGTNYGTLGDLGGWSGIVGRLFGGGDAMAHNALGSMFGGSAVAAMNVSAGTVIVNGGAGGTGGGLLSNVTRLLSGADDNTAGGGIQDQVWNFFRAKGLAPHQVAGIMGNVSAESSFNPLAIGDGGTSFGLFQHHASRGAGLLGALGGQGNLGDVHGQLEYVWKELLTTEKSALDALLSSRNVREATAAWGGFERPAGYSAQAPEAMHNWTGRLRDAEQAASRFGGAALDATGNLQQFGGGLGEMGRNLANAFPAAPGGGGLSGFGGSGLGFLTNIMRGFSLSPAATMNILGGGVGLYDTGGATGGSDPTRIAGLVHEQEYVFDAVSTARIGVGNLERIRQGVLKGYREGGYATSAGLSPSTGSGVRASGAPNIRIEVIDRVGASVEAGEARQDDNGDLVMPMILNQIEDRIAGSVHSGKVGRAMQQTYGLKRVTR